MILDFRNNKAFAEACKELRVPKCETIAKCCDKFNIIWESREEIVQNYWKQLCIVRFVLYSCRCLSVSYPQAQSLEQ